MTFETWLAFVAASAILVLIPGPTILLVVSYALGRGWRTALPMAAGVALGYALVASRARTLAASPRAIGLFNKVGGTALIGAGIATVTLRAGQG